MPLTPSQVAAQQELADYWEYYIKTCYLDVAASDSEALYFYDFLLTFDKEIVLIWGRPFTGATVLYILNRWLSAFSIVLSLVITFPRAGFTNQSSAMYVVVATPVFCALRIHAIWGRGNKVSFFVLSVGLVLPIISMVTYGATFEGALLSMPPIYNCVDNLRWSFQTYLQYDSISMVSLRLLIIILAARICAIALDVFVMVLTWRRTYGISKLVRGRSRPGFSKLILRDGTLYFATLVILNVIYLAVSPFNKQPAPVPPLIIRCVLLGRAEFMPYKPSSFTSILISHFMLNLREVYFADYEDELSGFLHSEGRETMRFASRVLGNMGAPLADDQYGHMNPGTEEYELPRISSNPIMAALPQDDRVERFAQE
ncbi:hypothetical protein B0H21DRAFT_710405 [Amylocystis lapponica]|nr:hypothetical protein B0H21DRAFT_710405 [Amylocystis lapponica]